MMEGHKRLDNASAQQVRDILGAAARLSGLRVCLYDTSGGLLSGIGEADTADFDMHRHTCAFCFTVRSLPGGREACIRSDVIEGTQLAMANGAPVFHTCHAGLTEIIVPILHDGRLLGTAFCGQCRLVGEDCPEAVMRKLAHFGGRQDSLKADYYLLPLIPLQAMRDTATLIDHAFRNLVHLLGNEALNEFFAFNKRSHVDNAKHYIGMHFCDAITVNSVARHLYITPAHLTRIFKGEVGVNVSDYIHQVRINKACELLAYPQIPISSIAFNVGYPDQNYFSRRFKRYTGMSPRRYRATLGDR